LSEGFRKDHVFVTGSPLREVLERYRHKINKSSILEELGLKQGQYFVISAHREENIDLADHFLQLVEALNAVAELYQMPVIFSTHPRTQKRIDAAGIQFHPLIRILKPFGFFDYVKLQVNAYCVLSDSGTISEESTMLEFPAVSIRTSTERPEAVDAGTIVLGGIDKKSVINSIELCIATFSKENRIIPWEYNVLDTSNRVMRIIQSYTSIVNRVTWNK